MAMNSAVSMTAGSAAYLGSPGARQIMLSNPQGISNANRNRQGFMMMDGSAIQANTANMNMGNIPSNGMSNGNSGKINHLNNSNSLRSSSSRSPPSGLTKRIGKRIFNEQNNNSLSRSPVNRSTTPNGGSRGGMYYFGQR